MVQGNQSRPLGTGLKQCLIPDFGLRSGVRKYKRGCAVLDLVCNVGHHSYSQVPSPGKALHTSLGQQRVYQKVFG